MQPVKEIVLSEPQRFTRNWGTEMVVEQRSRRERFERKKYMGVWRWGSRCDKMMINRLPLSVIT
jgi:hypothetical protein